MKVSVKYGLFTAAVVVGWMLLGYFFNLENTFGRNAGMLGLVFYAVGIFFSIKHTFDKEMTTRPADPRLLLKAGLITSLIVSLAYCVFIFVITELMGKVNAPVGNKIMGLLSLFIMNLLAGGLFSVILAFYYSRKAD
jgi:Na+/H+-translocating membrane pyrophosphatase